MIAAGFAALHIVIGLALLTPAPYHGGDNAAYVALARSILEKGRYLELWDPAQRSATLYPPAFPLVLAAAITVGLKSWIQLKIVTLFISAGAVLMSVLWLRRVAGMRAALAGGIILALSPGILQQASYVLSEGLFWFFTMIAFWAVSHIEVMQPVTDAGKGSASNDHRTRWLLITAAAAAGAILTRSTGLPLIVAITGALLLKRQWRDGAIFAAVTLLPFLAWSLRGRIVGARGYGSYLTMVDPYKPELGSIGPVQFIVRVITNTKAYLGEMIPSAIWSAEAALRPMLMLLVIAALMWWVFRLIRKPDVVDIWLLFYAGLLVIWPETWAGERFAIAIAPALIYFMWDLLQTFIARERTVGLGSAAVTMLLAVGVMVGVVASRMSGAAQCREAARGGDTYACGLPEFADFMRIAEASRAALPRNAVVISRKPTLFFTQSGLRSAMYPLSPDPARFFAAADTAGADYLVLDQLSPLAEMYLNPVILSAPSRFCAVRDLQEGRALMLQILPVARASRSSADAEGLVTMKACDGVS